MQESICLLKKILKDGDAIVVGVSGGPDSMCLLSFLDVSVIGISLKIIVAHVNHNVRDTANKDEEFVRRFALEKKYIFEKYKIDKLKGNFEAEARKIRYDFFESLIKKYNAKYLFTAHHGDDLIETIIMRLIRGAAFKGYRGIDFIINKEGYKLVRPLLYMTKDEILNYLKINSIDYCIDETNDLDFNTRNRIRHHILPELKKENADVHKKFLEFSGLIKNIDDFLSAYTNSVLNDIYINEELNLFKFNDLEDIIKQRVIEEILHKIYKNNLYIVTNKNINEIKKMINSNKPNGSINLPNNVIIIKEYGKLRLKKDKSIENDIIRFENEVNYNGLIIKKIEHSNEKSNYILRINSKEVKLPLYVRTRKNGDFIEVKNLGGKKKLKNVFIDEKISKGLRESIGILVDSNDNILWIPGIKKSKFDKEINEKYDIILKCEEEGEIYE